MATRTPQ